MQRDREPARRHATRVGDAHLMIDADLAGLGVQDLAVAPHRRLGAGGEHVREVALGDLACLGLDLGLGHVALGLAAREADDDVVDPLDARRRHLLGVEQRQADGAADLLHVDDLATADAARLDGAGADDLDRAVERGAEPVARVGLLDPGRVEAQHQTRDLGRAYVEHGEAPALDRRAQAGALAAVHLDPVEVHVRLPGSSPAASRRR